MNSGDPRDNQRHPTIYEIRIGGHLGRTAADRLGLDIAWDVDGTTRLSGPVIDQSALHGLLRRLRDLGVTLISINSKEEGMASNVQGAKGLDRRMVLSTVWIFALINYIYADIFTMFFDPAARSATTVMPMGALMVFAVLMETGIAMALLSRILRQGPNRLANIIVGAIQTAFVTWSLFGGTATPYYVFFVCIEVASLLFIVVYAATWKKEQAPQA